MDGEGESCSRGIQVKTWKGGSCSKKKRGRRGKLYFRFVFSSSINYSLLLKNCCIFIYNSGLSACLLHSISWTCCSGICIFYRFGLIRLFKICTPQNNILISVVTLVCFQRIIKEEWEAQRKREQEEKEQKQLEKRDREVKRTPGS